MLGGRPRRSRGAADRSGLRREQLGQEEYGEQNACDSQGRQHNGDATGSGGRGESQPGHDQQRQKDAQGFSTAG
jgi:hypothetical protein